MASSNNSFTSSSAFPNSTAEKLDDSNFLMWRQQVEPLIKSHHLQRSVANPIIPPRFLSDEDCVIGHGNPTYEDWELQDQVLLTWLQSTLSKSILSRVLGRIHSYQVWEKIHDYFHKQTRARAHQLLTELHVTVLADELIREFSKSRLFLIL